MKRALGPAAVILQTRRLAAPAGAAQPALFEIVAAPASTPTPAASAPQPPPVPQAPPVRLESQAPVPRAAETTVPRTNEREAADPVHAHYLELVQREVAAELAEALTARARDAAGGHPTHEDMRKALVQVIADMIPLDEPPAVSPDDRRALALIGPPGCGKTSMLVKLASRFKVRHGRSVGVLSLDNQRLGGGESLRRYAALLEIPFRHAQTAPQARQARRDLAHCHFVLIDTPGIGPRDALRLQRVESMLAATDPDEVHLVLSASASSAAQQRAAEHLAPLSPTHLMLTRLDEAVGLGTILNLISHFNAPLCYVGDGQRVPHDLSPACGRRLAELVLQQPNQALD